MRRCLLLTYDVRFVQEYEQADPVPTNSQDDVQTQDLEMAASGVPVAARTAGGGAGPGTGAAAGVAAVGAAGEAALGDGVTAGRCVGRTMGAGAPGAGALVEAGVAPLTPVPSGWQGQRHASANVV